jgi:hypothetical protein
MIGSEEDVQWTCDANATRIVIPAWVTRLGVRSFEAEGLEEVTFEPGSQLRQLDMYNFALCPLVKSLDIPASVEVLSVSHFATEDAFVGSALESITFERGSKLREIQEHSFSGYAFLKSISLPGSLESIDGSNNEVAGDSQLVSIGSWAFAFCGSLKSIVLPSTLETIGECCFAYCRLLEAVILTRNSKLRRIETRAFQCCSSLRSLSLPPLLAFVGEFAFYHSPMLLTLTFSSPSQVRELLDLPGPWRGSHDIPDSVEILQLCRAGRDPGGLTLRFGDKSRLREIRIKPGPLRISFRSHAPRYRLFLQLSSRSVKIFRSRLEFE